MDKALHSVDDIDIIYLSEKKEEDDAPAFMILSMQRFKYWSNMQEKAKITTQDKEIKSWKNGKKINCMDTIVNKTKQTAQKMTWAWL